MNFQVQPLTRLTSRIFSVSCSRRIWAVLQRYRRRAPSPRSPICRKSTFELRSFFRAARRVASAVGMRAGPPASLPPCTIRYSSPDRLAGEIALEDLACAGRVTRLRRQRRPGNVRSHAVMRHRPPRMVLRRRLREPDVAGISGELAALERADDGIAVAQLAARRVDQISAALESSATYR